MTSSTFFYEFLAIPTEVCPGAVPTARGVHKTARTAARTACLRVHVFSFLQSFPVHSAHPRGRHLPGLELIKTRRTKKVNPAGEKNHRRAEIFQIR